MRSKHSGTGALFLVVVLILASANGTTATGQEVTIARDNIYGHKDGMALFYDVLRPAKQNGAGVVFMVSGGWFSVWRDPEERIESFQILLDEGFTVFAVHHGSAPRFKVPDAVSDVRAAVRHIRKHAAEFAVDPQRLGVFGGSAGGHLTLMLGLNPEGLPDSSERGPRNIAPKYDVEADADARVAALVAYYPPVDIRNRVGANERYPALDFPVDAAAAISPILFVSPDDPPTLLIHGDADTVVPLRDSESIKAEFEKIGLIHELIVIPGGDHGFRNPHHRNRAGAAMADWFKKHLLTKN